MSTTTYAAQIVDSNEQDGFVPLEASSDDEALAKAIEVAARHPNDRVYCTFFRASDGQHGYINRDGADFSGQPL